MQVDIIVHSDSHEYVLHICVGSVAMVVGLLPPQDWPVRTQVSSERSQLNKSKGKVSRVPAGPVIPVVPPLSDHVNKCAVVDLSVVTNIGLSLVPDHTLNTERKFQYKKLYFLF